MSERPRGTQRPMPIWLGVGAALLAVAAVVARYGREEVFGILLLAGLLTTACGVGQYMRSGR